MISYVRFNGKTITQSTDRIIVLGATHVRNTMYIYIYLYLCMYVCMYCSQLRMQCSRLCSRVGLKSHTNAAPARHLDSEHPQVQAVKAFVERCGETHGIHKRLICNFDQVWTTHYEHSKRVLYKTGGTFGGAQGAAKTIDAKNDEKHSTSFEH